MSGNENQDVGAEQDPRAEQVEANNEVAEVPEDEEDMEDPGHYVWRRGRLRREAVGAWGQSRAGRLFRVWYPSV